MRTQCWKSVLTWICCPMTAVLLNVSLGGLAVAQDKIRIGVGVDPSYTTWWVAQDKGFSPNTRSMQN